jgi:hypothetical protein
MAKNTAADKYFEALTESYDAIIDAIKASNERGFRVSNNLLAEAQRGQREASSGRLPLTPPMSAASTAR